MRVRMPWFVLILSLVLAGIVHISAVLSLPWLAPLNAAARLEQLAPVNTLLVLPPASPAQQALPLMAPDIRYAVCRYDIADGPVRLKTSVLDDPWSIAFYDMQGDNFYTLRGNDVRRTDVNIVIASADDRITEASADAPEGQDQIILVTSPVSVGIAMIRAPLPGPSYAERAEAALSGAECGQYQPAPPAPAGAPAKPAAN